MYIRVLGRSLDSTTRAEDRVIYTQLLAAAARLTAMLEEGASRDAIEGWMQAERERYGRGYLSGTEGEAAEASFVALTESFARRFAKPS